jgi:hypothetical protein
MNNSGYNNVGNDSNSVRDSGNNLRLEEHQEEDLVVEEDFHLFFETNNNSQSISIAFTNNIFIKDDNNKPVEMISHLSSITITVRIFFVLFMLIVVSAFLLENINSSAVMEGGIKLKLMSEFELKMYLTQNALYGQVNGIEDAGWLEYELQNKTLELTKMK